MDFIDLVKKVFAARGEEKPDMYCFAGNGICVVTDGKLVVFEKNEDIKGEFMQVSLPTAFNEVGEFNPVSLAFMDQDGELMKGEKLAEGDRESKIIGGLNFMLPGLMEGGEVMDPKLEKAVTSGKEFILRHGASQTDAELIPAGAKNPQILKEQRLGAAFQGATAVGMNVSLKDFANMEPKPVFTYISGFRAVHMLMENIGAVVTFVYDKNKPPVEKGKENMAAEKKDMANIVAEAAAIAQPKAPPPLGAQTGDAGMPVPQPPKYEGDPIPAVSAATKDADTIKQNREAQAADKVPATATPKASDAFKSSGDSKKPVEDNNIVIDEIKPEEPKKDLPKEEDIEVPKTGTVQEEEVPAEGTVAFSATAEESAEEEKPETDETRLENMMGEFEAGKISNMRNDIIFLERLVKLQAKLLKKGSVCEKTMKENAVLKKENAEIKKKLEAFEKAQAALNAALGK